MKKLLAAAALASLSLSAYKISADEKVTLLNQLQKTSKELQIAVKDLSPEQLQFKAAPDRWSVADCIEHIALSEDFIRKIATDALKSPAKTEGMEARKMNDAKLLAALADRSQKAQAPEPLKPSNKFANAQEALAHFNQSRKETLAFVKTTDADLRAHVAAHPVFKEADSYQWLLLLAGHSGRHTQQILEVKADPNFPKK